MISSWPDGEAAVASAGFEVSVELALDVSEPLLEPVIPAWTVEDKDA
jgi:hypothetical protein